MSIMVEPGKETFAASVIVPTRNRANLLKGFLPALAEQVVEPPYEVIIADNGSTDDTRSFVESVSARWPHVRLIVEQRPGGTRARHAGAIAARSPLLIFIDDDMQTETNLVAEHLCAQSSTAGVVPRIVGLVFSCGIEQPPRRPGPRTPAAERGPARFELQPASHARRITHDAKLAGGNSRRRPVHQEPQLNHGADRAAITRGASARAFRHAD